MSRLELQPGAVLRVAAWPVEIGASFIGPPALVALARSVTNARHALAIESAATSTAIYAEVPRCADPQARRWLLAVRRRLGGQHASALAPLPAPPDTVAAVDAGVLAAIDDHAERRQRVAAQMAELDDELVRALHAQRMQLRKQAGTIRFRLALLMANPAVAHQWERFLARPSPALGAPMKARYRRLEGTVLHYLLRACGRPSPQGLLAGIVAVEPGDDEPEPHDDRASSLSVAPDPARAAVRVAPDLAVFASITELDVTAGTDTWDVLADAASRLPAGLTSRWADTVAGARQACTRLETAIAANDLASARVALDALAEVAGHLDARITLRPRVDQHLPFRAWWSDRARREIAAALERALRFHRVDGAAEAYRRARADALLARGGGPSLRGYLDANANAAAPTPPAPTRATALAAAGVASDADDLLDRWVRSSQDEGVLVAHLGDGSGIGRDAGPFGTAAMLPGQRWWFRWSRPQPGMVTTRFVPLLPESFAVDHQRLLASAGAVQVVGTDHPNPSAAVRPAGPCRVGGGCGADHMTRAELAVDTSSRAWLLDPDEPGRALLPVYDSSAAISPRDPVGRYLGALAMAHGWELTAYGFPHLQIESDLGRLPEVRVRERRERDVDETVLTPRRWTIHSEVIEELRSLNGAMRYCRWIEAVDDLEMDDIVLLKWEPTPGAPEYLFPSRSPLALEALVDHLPFGQGPLIAVALPPLTDDAAWPVRDEAGRRYLAELTVTWIAP